MSFDSFGLVPELLRAAAERGYDTPTPVQLRAIPEVLSGRDVLVGAQTGTGKTAAFTLPLLQRLASTTAQTRDPRALILVPTRELAAQVAESVKLYGKYLRLRSAVIFGGVGIHPQIDILRRGVDIIVATPGRLLDHVQQGTAHLGQVEMLVLDEADRMLDMGFIHDIKRILKLLPAKRQNLMFSATYSEDIRELASRLLRNPVTIDVARRNTAVESVEQVAYLVAKDQKRALLSHLFTSGDWQQALVFTRTKHGANRLAKQLEQDGISSAAIHGNKSQSARTKALADFKQGRVRALVATEVAARGLDITQLPHVVNYELPNVPEDYVHRIGRTGRAGATGVAVSLVSSDERDLLRSVERTIGRELVRADLPAFAPAPPSAPEPRRPMNSQPRSSGHRGQPSNSSGRSSRHRPSNNGRPSGNSSGNSGNRAQYDRGNR